MDTHGSVFILFREKYGEETRRRFEGAKKSENFFEKTRFTPLI